MGTTRLLALTVVAGWTLAPTAATALDPGGALDTLARPVTVGPVTADPDVTLAPGGAGAGTGVTLEVPGSPLAIGLGAGADEDGLTAGVRLPGSPSLPLPGDLPELAVPPVPELPLGTVPSLLDDPVVAAMPSAPPGSPAGAGTQPPAAQAAGRAPTDTRPVDAQPAVSARIGRPAGGLWTTIGIAAGRLAPWAALAALAVAFQAVLRSALRQRIRTRAAS